MKILSSWNSYQLNNVLNTSFGVNQSPTFPFYNSYMKSSSILVFSLRTRSHFIKDNHRLSSESQKTVISTPDIGYSFSINPPLTWKNSPHHWGYINKSIKHFQLWLEKKSFAKQLSSTLILLDFLDMIIDE
ncbi:hypothetical protein H8356DRAFT_1322745 [Neocallimastix lanati (nom. inval.)]|nr:hypothetical protein H8356DRAFT_1322745 [Neocallimastix sp. JGI-2020a]